MKHLFFIIILFSVQVLTAQTSETSISVAEVHKVAATGTYQFISNTPKRPEIFTNDILIQIEAKRLQNKDQYWKVSEMTTVYIPSAEKIASRDFLPLKMYADE